MKRFWWVLVLVVVAFGVWFRNWVRSAQRAEGLREQKEVERKALEEYQNIGNKGRAAKYELNKTLANSRSHWEEKKAQLEADIGQDKNKLADAWNRAFGRDPGAQRGEGAGEAL